MPTDFETVRDRAGRLVAAPVELVVRRESFAARFGGLRYRVRRSARLGEVRFDIARCWQFDLDDTVRAGRGGWLFGWHGEHVSSPVAHLVHTDGRVGVSAGGPFLEAWSSFDHMIEDHALLDEIAGWEPMSPSSLEDWVPYVSAGVPFRELPPVAEASGACTRWWRSEEVAVRQFHAWADVRPRPIGTMIWSRSGRVA